MRSFNKKFIFVTGLIGGSFFIWNRFDLPKPAQILAISETPKHEAKPKNNNDDPRPLALAKFRSQFGNEMDIQMSKNGRLLSATGKKNSADRATSDFRTTHSAATIARAREVLDAVKDLVGLESQFPLGLAVSRPDDDSVKVYFQETYQGVPLAPFGAVTVELGSQGELLKIESDYQAGLHIENETKLTSDSAKLQALAAATRMVGTQGAPNVDSGGPIVWVFPGAGPGGSSSARHAYQYYIDGIQIVVDATDGKVIYQRNRRQN